MSDKDVTLKIQPIRDIVKSRIEYRISLLQSQINFINTFLREIERSLTITKSQREELERSLNRLEDLLNKKLNENSEVYFIIESLKILDETIETLEKYHLGVTKDTVEKLKALYNL
jgi:Nsp1-like C-terminal region.